MFRNKVSVSDNLIKEVIKGRTCLAEVANKLKNDKKQKKGLLAIVLSQAIFCIRGPQRVNGARNTPKLQVKPVEKTTMYVFLAINGKSFLR